MEPHQETGHPLPPRQSRSLDEDNRYVKGRYYMFVEVFTQTYICLFPIIPWVCFLYDIPSSGRLIFSAILVILYIVFKMELYQETEGRELTRKLESCTKERDDYKDQFDALVVDSEEFPQRIQMEPHQETGQPLSPRQSRNLDEDNRYVKVLPTSFHCQEHVCHVSDCHDCHVHDLPMPVSRAMGRTDAELKEEKDLRNEVQDLTRNLESCTEERDTLVVESGEFQKPLQMEPHQETGHPLPPRQSRSLDEDNRYVKVLPTSFHCQVCHVSHCHNCHVNDLPMSVSGAMGRTDAELKEEKDLRNEVQELTRNLESCTEERDDYKDQFDALVVDSGVFQQRIQVFMMNIKDLNIIGDNCIIGDGNRMRVNTDSLPEVLTKLRELKKELCTANLSLEELREGVNTLTMSMDKGHTKAETIEVGVRELKQLVSDRPELKVYRECLHSLRDLKDNPKFQQGQFKFDDLPDQHAKSGVKRIAATLDESIWMQAAVRFGVNKDTIPATETDLTKRTRTIYAHLLYQWVCRESDITVKDLTDIIEDLQDERNRETRKRLEAALKPAILIQPAPPRDTKRLHAVDNKLGLMVPMMEQMLDQMNIFGEVMEGIDERTKKPNEDWSVQLPKEWKAMSKDQNMMEVDLSPSDKEYEDILVLLMKSLGRQPTIIKIQRIQNPTLYTQYCAKKKQMETENPKGTRNERVLWHGTSADTVSSINNHGFNRSYCGKHGNGLYFAVHAQYSDRGFSAPDSQGHKRMYCCLVLTGEYCHGRNGLRVPNPKPKAANHILYDSVTDNTGNPSTFVVFNDTQAYPEYMITYN